MGASNADGHAVWSIRVSGLLRDPITVPRLIHSSMGRPAENRRRLSRGFGPRSVHGPDGARRVSGGRLTMNRSWFLVSYEEIASQSLT